MIGLDIDQRNHFRILKAYFNAKAICPGKHIAVVGTAHGFHVRIPTKVKDIWKIHQVRLLLGDCKGRLSFDELKLQMGLFELYDTLFESKKSGEEEWNDEEPINVLAEPLWNDRRPANWRRCILWQRKRQQ